MASRDVVVGNKLGLHLRAAAAFVQLAETFPCAVALRRDGDEANGKSILSVLSLGASRGATLTIETRGRRAEEAVEALADLVANRFGEAE